MLVWRISSGLAVAARGGVFLGRDFAGGAVFYSPLAGESSNRISGKGSLLSCTGRGRQGRRLSTFAIEDCRGFRRLLGQRIPQWQSEPTGLHPRPVFGFHHVGVAEEQGFKGVLLALGLYMALLLRLVQNAATRERSRGMFWSWRRSGAWFHVLVTWQW